MNTPSSAVLDYVEVCVVFMYSPSVTAHRQCYPDCEVVDIRTPIVHNHIPELINRSSGCFCILLNMNCRATLHADDDRKVPTKFLDSAHTHRDFRCKKLCRLTMSEESFEPVVDNIHYPMNMKQNVYKKEKARLVAQGEYHYTSRTA